MGGRIFIAVGVTNFRWIMQVRKEKLGDRITALHKVVSPFGKVRD